MGANQQNNLDVTDNGERVTPDIKNWGYYAHLSIYRFALPYVQGKQVLDAGCGTGYGAYYLMSNGAAGVVAVDLSEKAIQFSQKRYAVSGLTYRVMSLEALDFPPGTKFDVIFTSNVLEHIANPDAFLSSAAELLSPDGVLIIAVPPVTTPGMLEQNLRNPYHINNLPPQVWIAKLERFFHKAQGFRHWMEDRWIKEDGMPIGIAFPPEETAVRETDFTFTPTDRDVLAQQHSNITVVAVAEKPRIEFLPPDVQKEYPHLSWYVQSLRDALNREDALKQAVLQLHDAKTQPEQRRSVEHEPGSVEIGSLLEPYRKRAEVAEAELRRIYSTRGWNFLQRFWKLKQTILGK